MYCSFWLYILIARTWFTYWLYFLILPTNHSYRWHLISILTSSASWMHQVLPDYVYWLHFLTVPTWCTYWHHLQNVLINCIYRVFILTVQKTVCVETLRIHYEVLLLFLKLLNLCEARKFGNDPAPRWAILPQSDLLSSIEILWGFFSITIHQLLEYTMIHQFWLSYANQYCS